MYYLDFLIDAHRRLSPAAYLEIGVQTGKTLAAAECRAVGVDPNFVITAELNGCVSLFRTSSDEYFSRPDPLAVTGGVPFDLTFIDGLHLFEFALRDFIHAERHSTARGVIVFDDVLPRTVDEAARARHTPAWTGDVFHVLRVLAEYRQDLCVVPLNTTPTGLLAVFGLDPSNTMLSERYDEVVARFRQPDPQVVPDDLLDRTTLVRPDRFLASGILELLAGLHPEASQSDVGAVLRPVVTAKLGEGFGGTSTSKAAGSASTRSRDRDKAVE